MLSIAFELDTNIANLVHCGKVRLCEYPYKDLCNLLLALIAVTVTVLPCEWAFAS